MVKLETLAPGARFRLPATGKTGTVVVKSRCSVTVKYDGAKVQKVIKDAFTGEEKTFETETRPVSIAPGTEIEVL